MNRQILSFTYNFDTSHLNNNNNGNSENSSNDNSGKNEINTTVPSSPSLSNSNYFSYLQNNNNYTNNTSTTPLITSTNLQSNNNMSLSNSYSHLNLGQSQYLPPIQTSSNYMSSPMPFNNQMSGGYLNAPLNVTNTLPPLKNLNPLSQSRPKINPLNYVPSTPNTPLYSSFPTSTSLYNNPLNGFGHEHLDLGGEENEELKKMNGQLGLSQFSQYIPTQENIQESSQDNHKETNDEDFNSDQKEPVLQNVISTFNLDCKLDLPKIQKKARNTEYHPKRFAALVMRIKSPQTTALIFSSGKVVVTGAKNESESKLACKKFARIVKKLDFPATFKDFKIQNIVASCEVGHKVSLETLKSSEHSSSCNFEPELFPGLIYKMIEPKVTLLIFVSGKIVITGAKNKKGVEAAFKNISPVLSNFKKPS